MAVCTEVVLPIYIFSVCTINNYVQLLGLYSIIRYSILWMDHFKSTLCRIYCADCNFTAQSSETVNPVYTRFGVTIAKEKIKVMGTKVYEMQHTDR